MQSALLLVDLQADFLQRPGLTPAAPVIIAAAAALLHGCRNRNVPVVHAHTVVRADGADCMPHWRQSGRAVCIDNTPGVLPPEELRPVAGETVFRKQFFSPFRDGALERQLRDAGITRVIVAGIYTHGCVRSAVLDAYERGFEVQVARDAIGTPDPLHGETTRRWLEQRAASFVAVDDILHSLGGTASAARDAALPREPAAVIDGQRISGAELPCIVHRDPADPAQVMAAVPVADRRLVVDAGTAARRAAADWSATAVDQRVGFLQRWSSTLAARRDEFIDLLGREIGKPIAAARQEVDWALAHIGIAAQQASSTGPATATGAETRYRPAGVVALVTPWNNPIAIPAGKIAPALAFGNTVIWKPAPQAARASLALLDSLMSAGLPPGAVNLLFGDGETVRDIVMSPAVDRVSLTGSIATGRAVAACCAADHKPLQAELGGNNAALILADCPLADELPALAQAAFSFAGQRCTAIRRFIVEAPLYEEFCGSLSDTVQRLRLGPADDPQTEVGPLISPTAVARIEEIIHAARAGGAVLLCGGTRPPGLERGCWLAPALLSDADPDSAIVQDESFGPVAVIQKAGDEQHAVALANGVQHGLLAGIHTRDPRRARRIADRIDAGILKLHAGPIALQADAPFGGWKASGIGPPEHGPFDREFYTRAQALYTGSGSA